jgi:hypothetical protein
VVIFLIVADVLLAVIATVLSSGRTSQRPAGAKREPLGGLFGKHANATSTTSGAPDGASSVTTASKAPSSFNTFAGGPQYSQQQLQGPGAPDPLGRADPYGADAQHSQAGSYSHPQPSHGPGAATHYP